MRKLFKKVTAVILTTVMMISLVPVSDQKVEAAEEGFDIGVVNFDATLSGADLEKQNLIKIKKYIKDGYSKGDEIILFPEYSLTSTKETAIDVDTNKSVTAISAMSEAYDMYILFGAMIKKEGKYYSATIICTPDGKIDTYEKTHLTDEEYKMGLSVGDEPYVLSTKYGKFGLALGQEFSDVAELGKYYYGSSVRMVLVSQAYGYETGNEKALSQAEYDMYTTTYAYLRMYSRYVAVANLYTTEGDTTYLGESHVCISYTNGWIAGCSDGVKPVETTEAGVESGTVAASSRDSSNGMSSRRLNQLADWYGEVSKYKLPQYGQGSKYKDDVKVASVNFHPVWGDLETNVKLIKDIMADAHEEGIEMLVFPEMALTGYDVVVPDSYDEELKEKFGDQYMQHVCAQVVRGDKPSTIITDIQKLAESYGMYVLIGLPEQDEVDPDLYWNSVAILGPDLIQSYRKVNLASPEPNWSAYGTENDGYFETPFGYVGVAICADIYNYQELQRTYSEMGCRIVVNCTAGAASNNCSDGSWQLSYQNRLESFMLRDDSFMVTSNLVGYEGPVTNAVTELLSAYGYTVDDLDTTWFADEEKSSVFKEITDLYGINNGTRISPRTYIFPGASVCIGLDDTTDTGTYVFGNYTDSGVTSNGTKYPYMNITPDTFNKYYVGDFDLSKATLYKFYSENPYDYRPDLYYKWYTELFYDTYGYELDKVTYKDAATGVTIYGDEVMSESKFNVTKSTPKLSDYKLSGYTATSATSYAITSDATLTTEYTKRNVGGTDGSTVETIKDTYTGNYVPYKGKILVSFPVGIKTDIMKVYTSKGVTDVPVVDGTATIELESDDVITIVGFTKLTDKPVTPVTKKITVANTKIKSVKRTSGKKAKIKLKKVKDATGYIVKYSTTKKFKAKKTKTKKVKKVIFTIKKLKAKKAYYVKVQAYKVVDKKTYYSKWTKAKKIKVKK
ncbi:MAG: carbon-nitrogen hydrolase family protein [Eubacterium sp.]